jgi:hypothetical protein
MGWIGRELFLTYPAIVLFCKMAVGCFQTEDRLLYICNRQDIYWIRRFGKVIEELDVKNTKGDNDENLRGDVPLYVRLYQHQTPDEEADYP